MKTLDFDYVLPDELIAQVPLDDRKESRLLVLDKKNGNIMHKKFIDILGFLNTGDCLVLNNTKVIPARLMGKKVGSGAGIEFLLLKHLGGDMWEVILKPGKKAKVGARFEFGDGELLAEVIQIDNSGNRIVRFEYDGIFEQILDKVGTMPLPPYITATLKDKDRYQTVYGTIKGSSAAPTAGLHFTSELLQGIEQKGVNIVYVTLHVGLATFRPVKTEDITEHTMHSELFSISKEAVDKINQAKKNNKKVLAVGTTSVRVLETCSDENGLLKPTRGETDIFIYPGYRFKTIDMLITNFHLPKSTLVMLVSALAGKDNVLNAYNKAILEKYRFFSFGDAMMII